MATTVGDIPAFAPSKALPLSKVRILFAEPFRIAGTELPDNVLLLAKIITLAFITTGQFRLLSRHFLPFLPVFDRLGSPALFHWTLITIFLLAATALFYNWHVRLCCLVLGADIFISLLSSRTYFENNRAFCACVLILAGLCARGQKPWPLRYQVVLVYFGAALNKLLQQDWRSGQFFSYWFGQIHHPDLWSKITVFIPGAPLAQFLCWTTITTELVLVMGFLVPKWYSWSIWLGAAYHTTLLVMMNTTFGMFYYAMLASYLAFVEWPQGPFEVFYDEKDRRWRRITRFSQVIDVTKLFTWRPLHVRANAFCPRGRTRVLLLTCGKLYSGFSAFRLVLLLNPVVYFGYVILLSRQPRFLEYHRWLAAAVLIAFLPIVQTLIESAHSGLLQLLPAARRQHPQ